MTQALPTDAHATSIFGPSLDLQEPFKSSLRGHRWSAIAFGLDLSGCPGTKRLGVKCSSAPLPHGPPRSSSDQQTLLPFMNPAGGHPPLPLLQLLYARTTDLGTFLTTLFDERERAALVTEADPPAFREHLRRTIVALDANYKAPSRPWRMSETGDTLGMREVRLASVRDYL